ncbi:leucine-rich_repeat domain-containing protein [Hexamita inflata]|uniref:Partial n=1 Tax=Hexamita inflata TaxID=28002 RepID=A0AA86RVM7_9EUKA|nr:leucine-rich repeat domain-containing protein [Hexamita inflata]
MKLYEILCNLGDQRRLYNEPVQIQNIEDIYQLLLKNIPFKFYQSSNAIDFLLVQKITNFVFLGQSIVEIGVISKFNELICLDLSKNQINDISSLSSLIKLQNVNLSQNFIEDIQPVSTLVNLTQLNISANNIYDISSISSLQKLNDLDIENNRIENLDPLQHLFELQYLHISENKFISISAIKQLTNLKTLSYVYDFDCLLEPSKVIMTPIYYLNQLTKLSLCAHTVTDIYPISRLNNLESLVIWCNKIVDISPLQFLVKLKNIDLQENCIISVDPLKNLLNVEQLYLTTNKIIDLASITHLKELISPQHNYEDDFQEQPTEDEILFYHKILTIHKSRYLLANQLFKRAKVTFQKVIKQNKQNVHLLLQSQLQLMNQTVQQLLVFINCK